MAERQYIAIDLKSFFASVECIERGLDPLTTNLVVADESRTEKTICLAVSPSLKSFGIPGRPRLFEVVQRINTVNTARRQKAPNRKFAGRTANYRILQKAPDMEVDYIVAQPRMALYMEYSTRIYQVYLKYIAPEDIHVYSIDEVLIDATPYLATYNTTAHELAMQMIRDVLSATGITATAGIGTNLYLAKIAMDIEAKKMKPDADGVRIAELDEMSYRQNLWTHRPLTDFWRVGRGYAKKLENIGLCTMGDIARCSISSEDLLYKMFGINAELLIDHAWGWEPCTISDIKAYKPESKSITQGQVLQYPYSFDKAKLVVREMADMLAFDLLEKGMVCDQIVLTVGYDIESAKAAEFKGEVETDRYGRKIPKHAHGSANLDRPTSSSKLIIDSALSLFDRIVDDELLVRRLNVVANHVLSEDDATVSERPEQLNLFDDPTVEHPAETDPAELERERRRREAMLEIRKKFGKNAILRGTSLKDGATAKTRNGQIGGHKA